MAMSKVRPDGQESTLNVGEPLTGSGRNHLPRCIMHASTITGIRIRPGRSLVQFTSTCSTTVPTPLAPTRGGAIYL